MGAHKGIKWKDKSSKVRYFSEGHRAENKERNIKKNNGPKFLETWKKKLKEKDK